MVAAIFYGRDAFDRYSAISILVNIPATIFATLVYEIILRDSFAIIAKGHAVHTDGEEGLVRHLTKTGTLESGQMEEGMGGNIVRGSNMNGTRDYFNGKEQGSPV